MAYSYEQAIKKYRQNHPEKVAEWRYNAAVNAVRKYEQEHPDAKVNRLAKGGALDGE